MNIKDLKYLLAVHDLNSFSKAAESCFVSQPTLSGQLKKLEQSLAAPLMERSTRKIIFTPLGHSVVEKAREILMLVEQIEQLAEAAGDLQVGDYHLGLIPTVGPFLLPLMMPLISKKFPKMNFYLHELQTDQLLEKLRKGELDAAILAKLDWPETYNEITLYEENMQLAVQANSHLSKLSTPIALSVLDGQSVLMLADGHCLRDQAMGVCFSAGANEDKRFQATSVDTLLHMVAMGSGITLMPELACNAKPGISYMRFSKPQPSREIVLLSRKNAVRNKVLKDMAACIKKAVED